MTITGQFFAAIVLSSLLLASPRALAQQPAPEPADNPAPTPTSAPPPAAEQPRKDMQEEIVVTGSRVRRKDLTTPAPVTVLSREQWQESGKLTIGDFLQSLPEQGNAPNFQLNNGGATYSADGSTRINLRSLGVTRTLVLLNGRRVVPGGVGASPAVDLNTIPTAAVDRIEVLKDGASAIYGSDAIAGVVNVITRKNFNGTEAAAQYGVSQRGDAQTFDGSVTTGRSTESGNLLFSLGYFNQKDSFLRDRAFSANAYTWNYATNTADPGGSLRTPAVTVALPQDPTTHAPMAGCSASTVCSALVNSDPNWRTDTFIRDANAPLGWRVSTDADRYNFASANYLTIPATRVQAYSSGDARFSLARGYYEMSYVQRNSTENAAPMPLNPGDFTLGGGNIPISVSPQNFYNPFGVSPDFAGRRLVEFGNRTYAQELGTFRVVTGVDGTLPEQAGPLHGWFWDASMNYGRTSGTFTTGGAIRNSRIADAVGPSFKLPSTGQVVCGNPGPDGVAGTSDDVIIPGCTPLNLFGLPGDGSIDPNQIAGLGFQGTSRAFDALFAVGANVAGDLVTIASDRPVSLALGYEFRRQSGAQIADPIAASRRLRRLQLPVDAGLLHLQRGVRGALHPAAREHRGREGPGGKRRRTLRGLQHLRQQLHLQVRRALHAGAGLHRPRHVLHRLPRPHHQRALSRAERDRAGGHRSLRQPEPGPARPSSASARGRAFRPAARTTAATRSLRTWAATAPSRRRRRRSSPPAWSSSRASCRSSR